MTQESLRSTEFGMKSHWLFFPAADSVFIQSKGRVFQRTDQNRNKSSHEKEKMKLIFETLPKWNILFDILKEIEFINTTMIPGRGMSFVYLSYVIIVLGKRRFVIVGEELHRQHLTYYFM
jgi:hypothetical protein